MKAKITVLVEYEFDPDSYADIDGDRIEGEELISTLKSDFCDGVIDCEPEHVTVEIIEDSAPDPTADLLEE